MPVARSDCQLERRRPALPVSIYQISKLLNLDHELRKSTAETAKYFRPFSFHERTSVQG